MERGLLPDIKRYGGRGRVSYTFHHVILKQKQKLNLSSDIVKLVMCLQHSNMNYFSLLIRFRNELERVFLELIQFNINVQQSAYAKYYFDLRSIAEQHGLTLPIDTLDKKRAKKLEVSPVSVVSQSRFALS